MEDSIIKKYWVIIAFVTFEGEVFESEIETPDPRKEFEDAMLMVYHRQLTFAQAVIMYSNAINHASKSKEIAVSLSEESGAVRVSVYNTGELIPEDELERIWIKFYKVDKARSREYGGSGIGLSIVKKIIEDHGGYIWATSREGEGTCMHFVLRKYMELEN